MCASIFSCFIAVVPPLVIWRFTGVILPSPPRWVTVVIPSSPPRRAIASAVATCLRRAARCPCHDPQSPRLLPCGTHVNDTLVTTLFRPRPAPRRPAAAARLAARILGPVALLTTHRACARSGRLLRRQQQVDDRLCRGGGGHVRRCAWREVPHCCRTAVACDDHAFVICGQPCQPFFEGCVWFSPSSVSETRVVEPGVHSVFLSRPDPALPLCSGVVPAKFDRGRPSRRASSPGGSARARNHPAASSGGPAIDTAAGKGGRSVWAGLPSHAANGPAHLLPCADCRAELLAHPRHILLANAHSCVLAQCGGLPGGMPQAGRVRSAVGFGGRLY